MDQLHGPDQSILVREFLNAIAIISCHLYRLKRVYDSPLPTILTPPFFLYLRDLGASAAKLPLSLQVASTMENIIEKNVLPNAGHVQGQRRSIDSRAFACNEDLSV